MAVVWFVIRIVMRDESMEACGGLQVNSLVDLTGTPDISPGMGSLLRDYE